MTAWIAALALWACLVVSQLFYSLPPVWPDEGTFGDVAYSLATGQGFAAPSLAGQVPGAERHLVWQPPVHTVAVAGAFKAMGAGVDAMRAVSLLAAAVLLAAVWRIGARMAGPLAAMIALTLLLADARFLRGAIVGRNDGLAMALAFLALWRGGGLAGGVFAGLAMSTHNAGAIAVAAIGVDLIVSRAGARAFARFAAGVAIGLAPWALQIALDADLFLQQFLLQLGRDSTPGSSTLGQITWNLDSRLPIALALWATYLAGALALARLWPDADARRLLFAAALALALNLARPEVTYVPWMTVPAAIGLAALAARAPSRGRVPIARVAVVLLIAAHAAYVAALAVRARQYDYIAFAASMRRCVVEAAPAGTRLLIDSVPEVYLAMLDQRDRIAIRLPSPVSGAANRRAALADLDAVLFGPIVWQPAWRDDVEAERERWRFVSMAPAGGYRATLAVRADARVSLPPGCQ